MQPVTKRVATLYGGWALLWLSVAFFGNALAGHGEYGITAHLTLSFTGIPLAPLSWHIHPNGSVLGTLAAGAIGVLQWCAVAELNARYNIWRSSKKHIV